MQFRSGWPPLNDRVIPLSSFYIDDYGDADFRCINYVTVLTDWPDGTHILVIDVFFEEDIDNGFSFWEAGPRTIIYTVTVGD